MASNEALVDASAFLELEKGFPEPTLDGVESACQAANKPVQAPQLSMRINQASLDRIAGAAQKGGMRTFGEFREGAQLAMDAVRQEQVDIFHEHMMMDILTEKKPEAERVEYNFSDKEFLLNFQRTHMKKEQQMSEIIRKLGELSTKLTDLNASIGTESSIPSDPLNESEKPQPAPKMSIKALGHKVIEQNKIKFAKMQLTVEDATRFNQITHGGHGQTLAHVDSSNSSSTPQSTGASSTGFGEEMRRQDKPSI